MIVTCPGCGSKYRVRDEAVPVGGAELKCPSCSALFMAHPPKHSDVEIASAVDRITKAKEGAEQRVVVVEREHAALERRAHDAEARVQQLEAQLRPLEAELQRLRDDAARTSARASNAADAEMRSLQLQEELARARAAANHAPEVQRLTEELQSAQKTTGRLYTELEIEKQNAERLTAELRDHKTAWTTVVTPGGGISGSVAALVSAVGPMLWGLEQAIKHLESTQTGDPAMANHLRQLLLLQGVLQRLARESAS